MTSAGAVSLMLIGFFCWPAEVAGGEFDDDVQLFVGKYCVHCHSEKAPKGGFSISKIDHRFSTEKAVQQWELALDMIEDHQMPPEGESQPSDEEKKSVTQWIDSNLRKFIQESKTPTPPPIARRLTNVEYQNTLRDLLGFELNVIDDLPKDPVKPYEFNNTPEMMQIGPEHIDRYLEVARRAMASAIVDPEKPETHKTRREWKPHGLDRGLGYDEVGVWGNRRNSAASGMGLKSFPRTGEYRIRVKASAILPKGISEVPLRLVMGYGLGENSATLRIEPVGTLQLKNSPDDPEIFEFRGRMENHPARPGRTINGIRRADTMVITPQNLYDDGTLNDGNRNLAMPRAVVEWMEFEAPLVDSWPPLHHQYILFDSPLRKTNHKAYINAVLKKFMTRAYRRPATENEVARFASIYEVVLSELNTTEAAMRETLSMVLISPQFLYHTFNDEKASKQFELASRLSYFLWGTMPDKELIDLAKKQKLDDPEIISQQVRRMLADKRSESFLKNFTMQWIGLAKLKTIPINRELFPRFLYYVSAGERAGTEVPYRPTIRDYMIDETIGFVGELIKRNASVLSIVDSDFVFLNQPLAAHYGVTGVQGNRLRPVPVGPNQHLGGLLTHASVLIANGTGTAPHPIYRAVWLREAILGEEVPDPPAEVPALTDSTGESTEKALTIKNVLEKHRQEESCNRCHIRLDPWGISFERFNAIGKFQPLVPVKGTRVRGFNKKTDHDLNGYAKYLDSINTVKVSAETRVPSGPSIDGVMALKTYLMEHRKKDIAENVIRRLLTYAVGRQLTFRDRLEVESLLIKSQQQNFKLQEIIVAICQSNTFRRKNNK